MVWSGMGVRFSGNGIAAIVEGDGEEDGWKRALTDRVRCGWLWLTAVLRQWSRPTNGTLWEEYEIGKYEYRGGHIE